MSLDLDKLQKGAMRRVRSGITAQAKRELRGFSAECERAAFLLGVGLRPTQSAPEGASKTFRNVSF